MAKYGMSMCVLGMHEELRPFNIAVNALWPRTAIWTAAMEMISGGTARKVSLLFLFSLLNCSVEERYEQNFIGWTEMEFFLTEIGQSEQSLYNFHFSLIVELFRIAVNQQLWQMPHMYYFLETATNIRDILLSTMKFYRRKE